MHIIKLRAIEISKKKPVAPKQPGKKAATKKAAAKKAPAKKADKPTKK